MLYKMHGLSRRIYPYDQEAPEYYPHSYMGYARGRWDGNDYVIKTTHLSRNVRDFNGGNILENIQIVERFTMSDGGSRLNMVLTLYDPENYLKPPIRRRALVLKNDTILYPYECDPDSFFRQLYNEKRMEEFIKETVKKLYHGTDRNYSLCSAS